MEKGRQLTGDRLIRLKEVVTIIGISSTSIWRRCKEGVFPSAIRIGPGAVAWRQSEIESWMDSRQSVTAGTVKPRVRGRRNGT